MPLVRFSVSIDKELVDAFAALAHARGYTNRSEALRDAMRSQLVRQEWERDDEVAGVITLLYDHHRHGVSEALTEIQHHALAEVISATHVHVDADNCLEFVAVKGEAQAIQKLADQMTSLKGVKHGALTATSTGKKLR
ncbi:MAG: nickel-responsive transcriptional regulator NikR [Thermotogota bacterium]